MMRNRYSLSEFIKTSFDFMITKVIYKNARLIRRPIFIRGRKSIEGGRGMTTGHFCRFDLPGDKKTLFIGDHCEMGDSVHIAAYDNVSIGDNVLMASNIFITDTSHGNYRGGVLRCTVFGTK